MAVTTQEGTEYGLLNASPPTVQNKQVLGGKVEIAMITAAQSGLGDAGSSVAVAKLPAGRVRLIGPMSNLYVNWTTASATMDVGWDAYEDFGGATVAADPNGIDDGINVEAAGHQSLGSAVLAAGGTKVFESKEGVTIRLTSADVAIADTNTVAGYIAYIAD